MNKISEASPEIIGEDDEKRLKKAEINGPSSRMLLNTLRTNTIAIESVALQEHIPRKKNFSRQLTMEEVNSEELERYKAEWHWDFFFEFLFYHLVFYILLGPFSNIIFCKWPGISLMSNMRFLKYHPQFFTQFLLWVGSSIGGLFYFFVDDSTISLTEIIFMWSAIAIRSVVIAAKYATLSHARIRLYKKQILPDKMFEFDLMFFDWYEQSGKIKFLEQYRSFRRHEFEMSLFKLDFIVPPQPKTKEKIISTNICFYIEWSMKQDIHITDPVSPDNTYSGFHIFSFLIDQFQQILPNGCFHKYIIFLSVFLAFSPLFLKIPLLADKGSSALDIARMVINIITSIQAFYGSFIFLAIGMYDFKRKFFLLDQCLYMLSAKKVKYDSSKKLLPTINFNDPQTLQAWSMLRSLSFDYGQTYNLRTQGFYSLIFVANIAFILISLMLILDMIHLNYYELILLAEMAILSLGFTCYYLYLGAQLNEYFDIFETLLDDVKSIYLDMQRLREQYFIKQIEPINDVHRIFVSMTRDRVPLEDIAEFLEKITKELDENIRLLNYDRRNNPFKLYGVSITFNLLKSAGVGLSTIYSFAFQQRFQPH